MDAVGGYSGSFYWDVVRTRIGIIIIMYSLESFAREQVELLKLLISIKIFKIFLNFNLLQQIELV